MALADRAELAVRLTLDDRQYTGGIRRVQSGLKGLAGSAGRVGKGVGQIGTGLARAGLIAGGAAVAGIAAVAKAAIDFEDAFAGVRKTVNETDLLSAGTSFEGLRQQILTMSTEIPIAATELARLGEVAGALGVKASSIDEFIRVTALLGVTTDLTSDQAAESLGKVGTILGLTGDQYEHFADILVNLGNQGASTESEILEMTKRFAATGEQAGLKANEILALASSLASMGIEAEAGGGALSRIFANMGTEIANASDKGKAFAEITGNSIKELQRRIDQGDALGILLDTLKGLEGLSRTEALTALKDLGITDTRNRNAIIAMANNLEFVNEQLDIAKMSTGALEAEAAKRFDTIASKLDLVKGNALRVAIAMGDEFIPAIGRAADRLVEFLQKPGTLEDAANLGKDIGKFIDGIDWNKVADGANQLKTALRGAADFALLMLKAFDTLPTELKGLLLGGAAVNKLSGGLIGAGVGNIFGGLGEVIARSLGSQLPGVGKLFVQPVFVTNWGGMPGGGGGVAGATRGGLSTLSKVFLVGEAIGLAVLVKEVADNVTTAAHEQSQAIHQTLNQSLAAPNTVGDLQTKLAGINQGINDIKGLGNIPEALFHETLVELETMRTQVVNELKVQTALDKVSREDAPADEQAKALLKSLPDQIAAKQQAKFERLRNRIEASRIATQTGTQKTGAKLDAVKVGQAAMKAALALKLEAAKQTSVANTARLSAVIRAAVPIVTTIVNVSGITQAVVKTGSTLSRQQQTNADRAAREGFG